MQLFRYYDSDIIKFHLLYKAPVNMINIIICHLFSQFCNKFYFWNPVLLLGVTLKKLWISKYVFWPIFWRWQLQEFSTFERICMWFWKVSRCSNLQLLPDTRYVGSIAVWVLVHCRSANGTGYVKGKIIEYLRQFLDFKATTHRLAFTFMKMLIANKITWK